jgi:hypothetical protein
MQKMHSELHYLKLILSVHEDRGHLGFYTLYTDSHRRFGDVYCLCFQGTSEYLNVKASILLAYPS